MGMGSNGMVVFIKGVYFIKGGREGRVVKGILS